MTTQRVDLLRTVRNFSRGHRTRLGSYSNDSIRIMDVYSEMKRFIESDTRGIDT